MSVRGGLAGSAPLRLRSTRRRAARSSVEQGGESQVRPIASLCGRRASCVRNVFTTSGIPRSRAVRRYHVSAAASGQGRPRPSRAKGYAIALARSCRRGVCRVPMSARAEVPDTRRRNRTFARPARDEQALPPSPVPDRKHRCRQTSEVGAVLARLVIRPTCAHPAFSPGSSSPR